MKNSFFGILMFLLASTTTLAQEKLELSFGDTAPALAYSKWIKGTPVTSLTGDKIYVLEFWATWCKPCIESMPHLSDLAEKYADRMKVIGVNVSERTGGKPYESSLPAVENFVAQNADNMRFDVIADNNNREMYNNWLKKGNIAGIPATIVVKNNEILWIGHPTFLDNVLTEIFEDKYNFSLRKRDYEEKMRASMKVMSAYSSHMKKIDAAFLKKDYKNAILAANEAIRADTGLAFQYKLKKLQILLDKADAHAVAEFLNDTAGEDMGQGLALSGYIAVQDSLTKTYDSIAINVIKKSSTNNAYYLDLMATMQDRIGDHAGAASTQEQALVAMKENEIKTPGKIKPEVFVEFENKIQKYKQAAKK